MVNVDGRTTNQPDERTEACTPMSHMLKQLQVPQKVGIV